MTEPSAARSRTTNWRAYNAALTQRGSLRTWLDREMTWLAPQGGELERPPVFSDAAIQLGPVDQGASVVAARDARGF